MTAQNKAQAIILIEKLRLIEAELFRLSSKYGVKNVDDFDLKLKKGDLSEEAIGDDIFNFDNLIEQKEEIEGEIANLSISRENIWTSFQDMLALPKLNLAS